jgi:hypothetical protein
MLVLGVLASASGCAEAPPPEEEKGSTESHLGTCEVLGAVVGASVAVEVYSASATGICVTGAVAVTVGTGGAAAAGSLVCLAPAASAGLAALSGLVFGGAAYLLCGQSQSAITPAEEASSTTDRNLTCTDDEHRELAQKKDEACNNLPNSCENFLKDAGGGAAMCISLAGRRDEYQKCRDARQEVVDRCFGGTPSDQAHADQIATMDTQVAACNSIILEVCPPES